MKTIASSWHVKIKKKDFKLSSESTDDGQIHLKVDELKELEAVHAWHVHVGDHQVELCLPALSIFNAVFASVTVVAVQQQGLLTERRKDHLAPILMD